jgi:ribosomal-protein-alanine N-acetyltransferase
MDPAFSAGLPFEVFHCVSDVNAGSVDSSLLECAIHDLSGGPDERSARDIFVIARLFANKHHRRMLWTFAKNGLGSAFVQVTCRAMSGSIAKREQTRCIRRLRRSRVFVIGFWYFHYESESMSVSHVAMPRLRTTILTDFVGRLCQTPAKGVSQKRPANQMLQLMDLQTPRLILRPFRQNDLDALAALLANPDFMRFSLGQHTREQTRAVLQKFLSWEQAGLPSQFAIVFRENNQILGYCGFLHHPEVPNEIEIGYRLHPDYWNRGLVTEAARAVRDYGFRDRNLSRVISLIHPDNVPSRRVAEKNGMKIETEITFRGFPTLVYAIKREQWLAEHGAL